ncbi:MAG: 3-hydroxyacyl-[acyl-carrier-protein] dehydratase FabZ [Candidatus Rokuibacteriota bacterium]|nr:MAG: 3-hydroxyacyl-[acyl-carrier-protein] dehydratase FabZ [Candidatus Rokubacteria bacterium]
MRFVFVDRIVGADPGRRIETLKNVSANEDVFADHFPGYPVFPGALVVESFAQACQLLIAMSHDFAEIGRLERLSRVAFARPIRPGDQLRIRCERRTGGDAWALDATATVDGVRVAAAVLEYTLERSAPGTGAARQAERLRVLQRELEPASLALAPRGSAAAAPGGVDE